MSNPSLWQIHPPVHPPDWLFQAIEPYLPEPSGQHAAQLLWQRGIRQPDQLAGFIDPKRYQPTSPFAFGEEMAWAIARLRKALEAKEKVAIWGDFDADGITATAVLWEGLGEFFLPDQLTYFIPNRLIESHGLSQSGIEALSAWGCSLIVTCDTGSTNSVEIDYAHSLGIDLIITDHHVLPSKRPPVTAILNPRYLPTDHPLAHLSGVAVAYKLIEALYETLPEYPQRPLDDLLDLVAIGLIADLVDLKGDCRYLAQIGIACLQKNQDPINPPRPGIAKLLELCRRNGDRPSDISFGLGPRINAISRIQGDARFCVELLTSQDQTQCHQLALETELANARRKALQREVVQDVKQKLAQIDLSTTRVIVLADPQWSVGILGLVAGQIAQEYGRPTILLSTEGSEALENSGEHPPLLARGSARSVNGVDLYALLQGQAALLHGFGGHPLAAGLSLPIENVSLFTQAVNQYLRSWGGKEPNSPVIEADLEVTVAELGKSLFQELKLLEPYGMGNPVPRLLIQNCWFTKPWHRKIQDLTKQKLDYIKTEFEMRDDSCSEGFPGVWWGHYKDELPPGRCDAIVELDFNSYEDSRRKKRYEIRLLAVRASALTPLALVAEPLDWLVDWRHKDEPTELNTKTVLPITNCLSSWNELYTWSRRARRSHQQLALAYGSPRIEPAIAIWQQLIGIAKYLSRTGKSMTHYQLQAKLGIGDRSLEMGFRALTLIGFQVALFESDEPEFRISHQSVTQPPTDLELTEAIEEFSRAVQEEQFMQQFFYQAPLSTIQTALGQASQLQ